ncbi:riboflavin kinase [Patescibacteria group bacterium]|nr:riboflavin kinase [Patescibacteria group bacterium]MBU1124035.1 riboflavin kinase [Patescibacteria group bacterium]MBU1911246.1 riboflavin kinase [Patescibacteria group bacterium]
MSPSLPITFSAKVIGGCGRGSGLGFPTINLSLDDIPDDLEEGIYAGKATIDQPSSASAELRPAGIRQSTFDCVIHYGPRPTFKESKAFEVHLIDHAPDSNPSDLSVELTKKIRDVKNFDSEDELKKRILEDIDEAHAILNISNEKQSV